MFTDTIETERLILRPFTIDDIEASYEMNLDPAVTRYTNDGGVKTLEEMEVIIKNVIYGDYEKYGFGRFAVTFRENGAFIGFSGLKYLPEYDEVDLGYRFKQQYWGMGIATESGIASVNFGFQKLKLNKIIGMVLPENKASIRVMEKLNFKFEEQVYESGILIYKYVLTIQHARVLDN